MNDVSNENPKIVNLMLEKLADYHVSFWLTTLKVQKLLGPAQSIYEGHDILWFTVFSRKYSNCQEGIFGKIVKNFGVQLAKVLWDGGTGW